MLHLNITTSSAIFIVSSLVGLWYSSGILPRYIATYRRQRRIVDPRTRLLSMGVHFEVLICESLRCLVHLLFLILGVWSLFIPPTPNGAVFHQPRHIVWFGYFFLWSLVGSNVALTLNTLIVRYGYRKRRGEEMPKLLPSRDKLAAMLQDIRHLQHGARKTNKRIEAEEARNDSIEARADSAHARADVAEENLQNHEGRIEIVEEVVEIKHTIRKKADGSDS